jgi:signal transduction histidine kinase
MEERIIIKNIKTNKTFLPPQIEELKSETKFAQENNLPDFSFGFFRISSQGDLIFINKALLNLLEYTSEKELLKKIDIEENLVNNFSLYKYRLLFKGGIDKEPPINKWIKNSGESILLKEHAQLVKNEKGETIYFDIMVEDVTEKEFNKRLLNDINIGDYSIFKAIPDILFVVSEKGSFIENKTNNFNNLFPRGGNYIGKSMKDLFSQTIADQFLEAIENTVLFGELQKFEFQIENNKLPYFYEARLVLTSNNQVLVLLRDITEQKLSEIKIKKFTEELEQVNKSKDKFFSIIGHDLRTPINGLLGYSEILANEIDILEKDEIKEYASSIIDISRTTNNLLTNLLEWSRIQTGRITFQPVTTNLFNIVNTVFNFINASAHQKNIDLINHVTPQTLIYADENMIQSILINLCSNAVKFTNAGGRVCVYCNEEKDNNIIQVEDNGQGISKLNLKNILKEQSYFSTIGTAKEKGTGLGLILCKEFVEKHSGNIWVESCEGKGTTFYFTIPKNIA